MQGVQRAIHDRSRMKRGKIQEVGAGKVLIYGDGAATLGLCKPAPRKGLVINLLFIVLFVLIFYLVAPRASLIRLH